MTGQRDTGTLIKTVGDAIENLDWPATETAIKALAAADPDKAQDVLDMLQAVLELRGVTP